jgi:flagellar protein FlbD
MIRLTRINHVPLVLNSDLIEHVEATPDTVITLTTGQKLMVLETANEVIERVIQFRRKIYDGALPCLGIRALGRNAPGVPDPGDGGNPDG